MEMKGTPQVARLTVIKPFPGKRAEVQEVVEAIMQWLRTQKGYVNGWALASVDNPDEIIRLTLWEDLDSVNAAATKQKNLALRSKLMRLAHEYATCGGVYGINDYLPKPAGKKSTS